MSDATRPNRAVANGKAKNQTDRSIIFCCEYRAQTTHIHPPGHPIAAFLRVFACVLIAIVIVFGFFFLLHHVSFPLSVSFASLLTRIFLTRLHTYALLQDTEFCCCGCVCVCVKAAEEIRFFKYIYLSFFNSFSHFFIHSKGRASLPFCFY